MPSLTHEQLDKKVEVLAAAHKGLTAIDFRPHALAGMPDEVEAGYGISESFPLGTGFADGLRNAFRKLQFDVGCWARLTHDQETFIDEADNDKRLEMAGILAMMTAPADQETFNTTALKLYEFLEAVAAGEPVTTYDPRRFGDDRLRKSGENNGKIQITFDNGHIGDRTISVWSDKPDEVYSDTPNERGFYSQIIFPVITLDVERFASGQVTVLYPGKAEAAA